MFSCSRDTLTRLYRDEGGRLERQIARRIGNRSLAQDLVQDVFLRLWERKGELQGNPAAFLSRAARNAAIDHLRRETVRRAWQAGAAPPLPPPDPAFELLSARQSAEAVRRALEAMPETTRRLFLMNRAQGLSFHEIAARCGMSRRNVAKHMARAVACCARALEEGGG